MSNHEYRDTEEASDLRFGDSMSEQGSMDRGAEMPYTGPGASRVVLDRQASDAHEDAVNELSDAHQRDVTGLNRHPLTDYFGAPAESWKPMPSRMPGLAMREAQNPYEPIGLHYRSSDGTVRHNLAGFPWEHNRRSGVETSNIELRTIYAHLIEAASLARQEMRERGMQVDL